MFASGEFHLPAILLWDSEKPERRTHNAELRIAKKGGDPTVLNSKLCVLRS